MGSKRFVAAIVLIALQVVVFISLALAGPDDAPHRAPVRVVAPAVVATAVVDRANELAGHPVQARALETAGEARRSVANGNSVAAVVVDLRQETDVVYVAGANGADLNRAVLKEVKRVEQSFGRSVSVRDIAPATASEIRGIYLLIGISVLFGFVGPIVITWVRGPVALTFRRGVVRLGIAAGASLAAGLAIAAIAAGAYGYGLFAWWLISALTMLAIATTTMALESVLGVVGIGASATVVVLTGAPLVRLTHPLLLPQPWSAITPWLPHGAAIDAGRGAACFGGAGVQPVMVLVVWSLLAIMTLVVARRERERDLTSG